MEIVVLNPTIKGALYFKQPGNNKDSEVYRLTS